MIEKLAKTAARFAYQWDEPCPKEYGPKGNRYCDHDTCEAWRAHATYLRWVKSRSAK